MNHRAIAFVASAMKNVLRAPWIVGVALSLASSSALAQTPAQRLEGLTPEDLRLAGPLAARGVVGLVSRPDDGPGARVTVLVPVNAPVATVHAVLADASQWPTFMPALRSVELLSRAGNRAAWRFGSTGPMLDVNAVCTVRELGPRRVDFGLTEGEFGPAGARWDLYDDGPGRTLMAVTSWSDPSQGHWLIRQAASSNPSATAGMNLAVDTSLALAIARRASVLSGHAAPLRPASVAAPIGELAALPQGPWVELTRRVYVVVFSLNPDGAVAQIAVAGQAGVAPEVVTARIDDVGGYPQHIPGVRGAQRDGGTALSPRFRVNFGGAWESGGGTVERTHPTADTVLLRGLDGELTDSRWRWDVSRDPGGATVVQVAGGVDRDLASLFTRVAVSREPYLLAGIAALRRLVTLRYMLNGLHG